MRATLKPGLRRTGELAIDESLTVPSLAGRFDGFADMPKVFATAYMVGFIEATCVDCLRGHLDEGEHTVGIHVDVGHVAASKVGMRARAEVELLAVEGRILTFAVKVYDDIEVIGEGTHRRAVVNVRRFMEKTDAKWS
ncbi:thioesterase family protein [Varunaivibrio sulfuroxidans]|uniref:Fluoroacetyl-CoA thioesterase n=1 Tax=Varunaivibrio sulfuroxidans TaxID=1773489 RepID=A0A4R3J9U0_9PROT|nr:thioesterase family protein [Varunaivibrio sulfuroxidans]TCS62175.1 fluoroacetyl-CoA thioesterase [Varunaivibrio sulfuroxidans]WES30602.1 thioesterase family protein [Varunaivibrio sulfuroxidans]